ncbi:MAG: SIMPL domain-containing protein [Acidimicrobiia bacterium]|nr:SIMPL domain-containing protein [Acidimicrobiia bacterium]
MMRNPARLAILLGSVACIAGGCTTTSAGAAAGEPNRTITGTATGAATGIPDTATISLGAESRGATATEALAANAKSVQGVIDAMQFVGVKKSEIQTSNVSLFPTFDQKGRITGYTVSTRMSAKSHDIPNAGKIIDAAAQLAGDDLRVDNVALSIEDTGPVVQAARRRAVRAAHDQASELARAAGVRLGPVRTIVEPRGSTPAVHALQADAAFSTRQAIPISAGTQDLEITVKVIYGIA